MNRVFKLKPEQWNNARRCRFLFSKKCKENVTFIIHSVIYHWDKPGREFVQEWYACDYHAQNHIDSAAKNKRKLEMIDGQPERRAEQV